MRMRLLAAGWVLAVAIMARADDAKPKLAVLPLAGDASADMRDKVGFAIRAKLDRDGTYEVIDGPTMQDLAGDTPFPFSSKTPDVEKVAKAGDADVMIWGELNAKGDGYTLRVHVFDVRQLDPLPHDVVKDVAKPQDLRFVVEEVVKAVADTQAPTHPDEVAVHNDAAADKLWQTNPNLVVDGDFEKAGHWTGLYQAEVYTVHFADALPDLDKMVLYRRPADGANGNAVLAMNLSKQAAENNGLACLSDGIAIEPNTRYRLSFRYNSDGPVLHVFVKGYTTGKDIAGNMIDREIYMRQVPPTGQTGGQWKTVVDDLNPQHPQFKVEKLKIDLYAYLKPGNVQFDDVVLKAVGGQTRMAKDDAIKPGPATQP